MIPLHRMDVAIITLCCGCSEETRCSSDNFKEAVVELVNSIIKESQEVMRITKKAAEACTDTNMRKVN